MKVGTCLQNQKSLKSLDNQEGIYSLQFYDYPGVFENSYTDDRRFVVYSVLDADEFPRLSKDVAKEIEEQGASIVCNFAVIDYDNPDHSSWTKPKLRAFYDQLGKIPADDPLNNYCLFYLTPRGARFVYKLKNALRYDYYVHLINLISRRFLAFGIEIDSASDQWNKLWRLPKVFREDDNTHTGSLPFFDKVDSYDTILDTKLISSSLKGWSRPSKEEVEILVRQINWTNIKNKLKLTKCYQHIFKDQAIAEIGKRTDTIKSMVGQAIARLYGHKDVRPEIIYCLFYNSVGCLKPDNGTPDWLAVLWDVIKYIWTSHEKHEANAATQKDLTDLLEKVKVWNPEATTDWLTRRLILSQNGKNCYLLDLNGIYHPFSIPITLLRSKIHESGMDKYIPLFKLTGKAVARISVNEIMDQYCKHITEVVYTPKNEGPLLQDNRLELPVHRLNPKLTPQYNPDVDEWLRLLGGKKQKHFLAWLAWSVEIGAGAICALAIVGPPGVGKKLLPYGLAECFENPKIASEYEFGEYQHFLLETPIVLFDEGIPKNLKKHPADFFRIYVSGGQIPINKKFENPVILKSALRIIFCGNSEDILKPLFDGRSLTPDDMAAISQRILIIKASKLAARFLRDNGGFRFTKGWIASDGADDSNYVIARHILWLNQEAKKEGGPPGTRFIVDGQSHNSDFHSIVLAQKDYTDAFEILIDLLGRKDRIHYNVLVSRRDGHTYFTPKGLQQFAKKIYQTKFSFNEINRYFATILPDGYKVCARSVNGSQKFKWYRIDMRKLRSICTSIGLELPDNISNPLKRKDIEH